MAETVTYTIVFDKKTGALVTTEAEVKKLENALKKSEKQAKKTAKEVGGVGDFIKRVGIAAFAINIARQFLSASDAMNELNSELQRSVGLLTAEAEPALKIISNGLQSLLIITIGIVKFIKTEAVNIGAIITGLVSGNILKSIRAVRDIGTESVVKLGDAISTAADRAAGITKVSERVQSKIILEEAKVRLQDISLFAFERLKVVDTAEKKALELLFKSGEFQVLDKKRQRKAEFEILKELSTERAKAQAQIQQISSRSALRQIKAAQDQSAAILDDQQITLDKKIELLEQEHALELEGVRAQGLILFQTKEEIDARVLESESRFSKAIIALQNSTAEQQNAILAKRTAVVKKFTDVIISEASKAEGNIRDLLRRSGAQQIKMVAKIAADSIIINGVNAAWAAMGSLGPIAGPLAAAGIIAASVAAAAGVAALGGAAAKAISGGAPPSEPLAATDPFAAPTPVAAGGGAGAGGAGGGRNVFLTINTLGVIPPDVLRQIADGLAEDGRI